MLDRKEQEHILLSFERDYGKLVMQHNMSPQNNLLTSQGIALIEEIRHVSAYLEDDIIECLTGISNAITSFLHAQKYAQAA